MIRVVLGEDQLADIERATKQFLELLANTLALLFRTRVYDHVPVVRRDEVGVRDRVDHRDMIIDPLGGALRIPTDHGDDRMIERSVLGHTLNLVSNDT